MIFRLSTPIEKIPAEIIEIILNGSDDIITVPVEYNKWNVQNYQISFDGIIKMLEEQTERAEMTLAKTWKTSGW